MPDKNLPASEEEKIEKDIQKVDMDIDMLSKVTFMDSLLDKQTEIRNVLDTRSNIVVGFDSALVVLLVTYFREHLSDTPVLWMLLIILITSLLLAIIALKPPHYSTKKGQHESIFYHHYIDAKEVEEYRGEIHKVLSDRKAIFDAYITEIYNLTKYSNIPRKIYLYSSLRVLIYGFLLVLVVYVATWIFNFFTL